MNDAGICALLSSSDCTLEALLKQPNILKEIGQCNRDLVSYLFRHVEELMPLAFSLTESEFTSPARGVLVNLSIGYPAEFAESSLFHAAMNKFLEGSEMYRPVLTMITVVLKNIIFQCDEDVLTALTENMYFLPRLAMRLNYECVYSMFEETMGSPREPVTWFFSQLRTTRVFYDLICKGETDVARALHLMSLLVHYTTLSDGSKTISDLAEEEVTERILGLAMHGGLKESEAAWDLLFELCMAAFEVVADESVLDEDGLREKVLLLVQGKLSEICEFIGNAEVFQPGHSKAIRVVLEFVRWLRGNVGPCLLEMMKKLWNEFFANPVNSKLHVGFQTLFKVLLTYRQLGEEMLRTLDMKKRIVAEVQKRDEVVASYWGFLTEFTEQICAFERTSGNNDPEWSAYVEGHYQDVKSILDARYGYPEKSGFGDSNSDIPEFERVTSEDPHADDGEDVSEEESSDEMRNEHDALFSDEEDYGDLDLSSDDEEQIALKSKVVILGDGSDEPLDLESMSDGEEEYMELEYMSDDEAKEHGNEDNDAHPDEHEDDAAHEEEEDSHETGDDVHDEGDAANEEEEDDNHEAEGDVHDEDDGAHEEEEEEDTHETGGDAHEDDGANEEEEDTHETGGEAHEDDGANEEEEEDNHETGGDVHDEDDGAHEEEEEDNHETGGDAHEKEEDDNHEIGGDIYQYGAREEEEEDNHETRGDDHEEDDWKELLNVTSFDDLVDLDLHGDEIDGPLETREEFSD